MRPLLIAALAIAIDTTPLLGGVTEAGHNTATLYQQAPSVGYTLAPSVSYSTVAPQYTATTTQARIGPTSGPLRDVENDGNRLLRRARVKRQVLRQTRDLRRGDIDAVTLRYTDLVTTQAVVAPQVCTSCTCQQVATRQYTQVPVTTYESRTTRVPITTYEERTIKVPVTTYEERTEEVPVTRYQLQECCPPAPTVSQSLAPVPEIAESVGITE